MVNNIDDFSCTSGGNTHCTRRDIKSQRRKNTQSIQIVTCDLLIITIFYELLHDEGLITNNMGLQTLQNMKSTRMLIGHSRLNNGLVYYLKDNPDSHVFVCDRTVHWIIQSVWIHPTIRRRGCGTRLMNHVHRHARSYGIRKITLDNCADNGNDFYEKLGYKKKLASCNTMEYRFM